MQSTPGDVSPSLPPRARLRWWPAGLVILLLAVVVIGIRWRTDLPYQSRNLASMAAGLVAVALLWLWWMLASRAPWRWRLGLGGGLLLLVAAGAGLFRIRGVSGDLLPILEPRWAGSSAAAAPTSGEGRGGEVASARPEPAAARPDFPQYLGPNRDGVLPGPALDPDWTARPPEVLWRQPVGPAWSGFAVVGNRAVTQEQAGEIEQVTCHDVATGRRLWEHGDAVQFRTTIAGEGPRCTPTVVGTRVYTLGATGVLNCLDLADGRRCWSRQITTDAGSGVPEWGLAGAPLHYGGRILVSAGGGEGRSLLAYDAATGELAWTGGSRPVSYSLPTRLTLAGREQVLMFNHRHITAHAPEDGAVLWEYPWGHGQPHVAPPVAVGSNRVVFSSGYGVGAELLEIAAGPDGRLGATRLWKSIRLKSKFANFFARDGHLYGLDDGVLVCVALADGGLRWKEGRYGHGQMLWVGAWLLVMAEEGSVVLLQPTPDGPGETRRFRVLAGKTWNPPALSGDLLLVRNDREAAAVRLPVMRAP